MKVIDDDDEFVSSTLIDEIALMLPCCQKLLPWISVTGHRHSGFGGGEAPLRNLRYPSLVVRRRRRRRHPPENRAHASLLPKIGADGFSLRGTVTRARDYTLVRLR